MLKNVIANVIGKEVKLETRTVAGEMNERYADITEMIHFDNIEYK